MNMMDNMTPEAIDGHIRVMMRGMGWQLMMARLAQEREAIIAEGKKSRAHEKQVKIWAKLDGFDLSASVCERMLIARTDSEEAESFIED